MTDDVRSALEDLAASVDLPALRPAELAARASGRRRRHRSLGAAGVVLVALALPTAWAVVQPPDRVVTGPAAPAVGGALVQGRFEVRYDDRLYDERRASDGISSCSRLPGLRYTVSLESLPPIDLLRFVGSEAQLAQAKSCLGDLPAASATFLPEAGPPVELRLSARQEGKRLQVSVGELRASSEEQLEHTLSVRNTTDARVYVDDVRIAADLAGGALLVRSQVCSELASNGEPEEGAGDCRSRYSPVSLGPGETWSTLVSVTQQQGPSAPALAAGEYTLSTGVSMRTTAPFTPGDRDATDGVLFDLTYEVHDPIGPPQAPLAEPAPAAPTQTVQVFFSSTAQDGPGDYCDQVVAVPREVPATQAVATAALEQLFRGPTPEEQRTYGVGSLFSAATADLLRSVRIADGIAYVDLRDFTTHRARDTLGSAGTSCGGSAFAASVRRTILQFPTVRDVRFAFDGDPRAFLEYMQGGCEEPVRPGDPCDPAPFRR